MQVTTQEQIDFYNYLLINAVVLGGLSLDPNGITYEFLYALEKEIEFYQEKKCLSLFEKNNLYHLFHQLRFQVNVTDPFLKESIFQWCNEQIGKVNSIGEKNYYPFLLQFFQEYRYDDTKPLLIQRKKIEKRLPVLRVGLRNLFGLWDSLIQNDYYEETCIYLIHDPYLEHRIDVLLKNYSHNIEEEEICRLRYALEVQQKIVQHFPMLKDHFEVRINKEEKMLVYQFSKEDLKDFKEKINLKKLEKRHYDLKKLEMKRKKLVKGRE